MFQLYSHTDFKSDNLKQAIDRRFSILLLTGFFIFFPVFWKISGAASAQVADFSGTPIIGCAPLVVQFTDHSTGGPTSWTWDFGNSGTSTNQNPSSIYSIPGVYSVTLTVSNGTSTNTIVKPNYITVYNKPTAGFSMSGDTACVGKTVTFTDATIISPGGAAISSYGWNFGDGNATTVTTTTVSHTYTTPGHYPISLIVTDINGCTGSIVQSIVIVPIPTSAFTATPRSSCVPPLNVTFTNTSSSTGPTTYTWHFGDGTSSNATNPTHTYTAMGTYNVTLVVNQHGCSDSIVQSNYISIQNMAANFVATPSVVCTGQAITFNNTSVPVATTASWDFGDAGTSTAVSPSHTYTAAGTYTVSLLAGNGTCSNTTTGTVTVDQTPAANFTADTMSSCAVPFTVNFSNTSTGGTNYTWSFGDGSPISNQPNPTHVYTQPGTYTVSLIATNSSGPCSNTIVKNNFIKISLPVAGFTHAPDSGCAPLTVNFIDTSSSMFSTISTYIWNFGDGNSANLSTPGTTHTYTATGIYSVKLVVQTANGCTDTIVCNKCIKVGTTPIAKFGIAKDTICYGLTIQFNDSSTNATGWNWIFGDGQFSNLPSPSHLYADTGTYHVKLVAYNNGCSDTSVIKNVVVLPPKAVLTYTLSCTNYFTVHFSSTSEGADSLLWDFGDGSKDSSNTKNPVHTYLIRGLFNVTLTAYNYASKCSNSATTSFTIAKPIASFSVTTTADCYPFTAHFTNTSQDANTVLWNFGDPSTLLDTSILSNPAYTYADTGQYHVTLIITDVNTCKDTITDTLKSFGPHPYFYATPLRGCRPLFVTFVDTSKSDSALVRWIWNFGDGTIDTTKKDSITHIYSAPGFYSVTMTVKDTNQCVKTIVKNNYIQPTFPFPSFTADTFACKGDVLSFNASATSVVGGTYFWHFGDGTIDSTHNPVIPHTYTNDNLYNVILIVRDTNGCVDSIKHNTLILKPTAHFRDSILSVGCGTLQMAFKDSSVGYVNTWNWNFGDNPPGTSTLQNPIYTYTQPGVYNVSLVVTNLGGCKDTLQLDSIIVVPGPVGSFTFTPAVGCNPLNVCFHSTSINAQNFIWDFRDGTTLQTHGGDTCHTYTNPGNFNPVLLLGNTLPNGSPCQLPATNNTGSVTVTNVVNVTLSGPHVIHVPMDSIVAVAANHSGGTAPYTYHWSPSKGINCDSCTSILILGLGDTTVYTFTMYDASGCEGKDSVLILSEPCFQKKLIPDVFSPNGDGINDLFYIPGVCPYEKYSIEIFDRWGVRMFSTTQRNNAWDGRTTAGVEAEAGVYYFVVTLSGQLDQKAKPVEDSTYKGFVHLVR